MKSKGSVAPKRKKSNNYIDKAQMLLEVKKSKKRLIEKPELGASALTRELSDMFMLLVERYFMKPNWANYTWVEEYKGDALYCLCNKWHKFDADKYNDPFAYYTKIIHRSALGTLDKEKKVQKIKDNVIESMGLTPSFTRQMENEKAIAEKMKEEAAAKEEEESSKDDINYDIDVDNPHYD